MNYPVFLSITQVHSGAVLIRDFLDDGQTQSGTSRLGGDIGLESSLQNIRSKTRATVTDAQAHSLRCIDPAGLDSDYPLSLPCFQGSLFCRILGILQKIVDDLPQLLAITLDHGAIFVE